MLEAPWTANDWVTGWQRAVQAFEGVRFENPKYDRFAFHLGLLDDAYRARDQQTFRACAEKIEQAQAYFVVRDVREEGTGE
jgi:hypothetical protein